MSSLFLKSRPTDLLYFVTSPIFGPGPEQDPTESGIFETSDLVLYFQMFLKFPLTYLVQYIQCFLKRLTVASLYSVQILSKKFSFLLYPIYRTKCRNPEFRIWNDIQGSPLDPEWFDDLKGRLGSRPRMFWKLGSGTAIFCIPDPIRNRICIRIQRKMEDKIKKYQRWNNAACSI